MQGFKATFAYIVLVFFWDQIQGQVHFDITEKVPFRLTQNIIDGFGITGVEGVFRRCCEITLRILRENRNSLISVLESFVHDPLLDLQLTRGGKVEVSTSKCEDISVFLLPTVFLA